jgi:glycosyltransferase involved in cell wall biosynthesis
LGRLIEKKGGKYLLHAMQTVKAWIPDAELTIIGDGPLGPALRRLSAERGIGARFLGVLKPADVKSELDNVRVLCLPSVRAANGDAESFGMVLLEAQACGVPVVTSARGGAQEGILEGVTGFSFPEGDVVELSQRLTEILSDDALAEATAAAGPRFVAAQFGIRDCTAALEQLYDRHCQTSAN